MLFIGTKFSILYTSMYSSLLAAASVAEHRLVRFSADSRTSLGLRQTRLTLVFSVKTRDLHLPPASGGDGRSTVS